MQRPDSVLFTIHNMGTPIGTLQLTVCGDRLAGIRWVEEAPETAAPTHPLLQETVRQLREYFEGRRKTFSLPLAPVGTDFQKAVWRQLCRIPYGETRTYGEIAAALGCPGTARAVGNACNKNNFLIVVPCHRVCKAGGLGGFALDLRIKKSLLELEKPVVMGFSEAL